MKRRDMLKTLGATAAGIAAGGLQGAEAAEQNEPTTPCELHNPYGAPPGSGVSMPAYYLPTPSVKINSC
jgi:hypothetical protein